MLLHLLHRFTQNISGDRLNAPTAFEGLARQLCNLGLLTSSEVAPLLRDYGMFRSAFHRTFEGTRMAGGARSGGGVNLNNSRLHTHGKALTTLPWFRELRMERN